MKKKKKKKTEICRPENKRFRNSRLSLGAAPGKCLIFAVSKPLEIAFLAKNTIKITLCK